MKTIELVPLIEYVPEPMHSFLEQPLTLGMFVPCDLEGNVLEKPKMWDAFWEFKPEEGIYTANEARECEKYESALDRVIFEGFEVDKSFKGWGCVTNGSVRLHFIKQNITIETIGQFSYSVSVKTISDLTGYGLKIKMR